MRRSPRVTVLVHHPDLAQAKAYAALVRTPRAGVRVAVSSTWDQAAAGAGDADVVFGWKFPADLYPRATRLAWLQAMGAGVDWALAPTLPPRVTVTRAPGIFGPWMREYVLGWCLWATQRTETYRAAQRERHWREEVLPARLAGQTMAIVGMGDIGRTLAAAARALGLRVIGVSRSGRAVREAERVYRVARLERALGEADFVVLVLPLTEATRGLVGARALAAMKPSAWLVNIGRGGLLDEPALLAALRERRIGGAILDVFPIEPLPPEHPLWGLDNVVITPHISGPSTPAEITPVFNANLVRWLAGRPLRHVVDRARGY